MSDATKQDFYTIFVNRQTYFGMPVSIHAPAWGATISIITAIHSRAIFQSTHPRGVRLFLDVIVDSPIPFQSTHPRGVRRSRISRLKRSGSISIHAPAWGATLSFPQASNLDHYFNPRTRVGCDPISCRRHGLTNDFNPRTRVGCDSADCRRRGFF